MIKFFDFIFTVPRWLGFMAAILFGAIYHVGHLHFGYAITGGWLLLFLIIGGLVANPPMVLALAVIISGYSFYAIPDTSRDIQISLLSILTAALLGAYSHYRQYLENQREAAWIEAGRQKQMADEMMQLHSVLEAVNGNIGKVKQIRIDLQAVLHNYNIPDDIRTQLHAIVNMLNNLELAVSGWRALRKIQEDVKRAKLEIGKRTRRPTRALGRPEE